MLARFQLKMTSPSKPTAGPSLMELSTVEAEYSADSAARLVLARIIAKIEKSDPNFHRKQVQSTRRSVKSGKLSHVLTL